MSEALCYANGRLLEDQAFSPAGKHAIEDRLLSSRRSPTYEALASVPFSTWGPEWLAFALDEILRAAALPRDWDGEGSPPPCAEAVKTAVSLLLSLVHYELPTPFVCPLRGGGLQLQWRKSGRELEVEFWDAPQFEYLKVYKDGSMDEGRCRSSDFRALRRLAQWLGAGA